MNQIRASGSLPPRLPETAPQAGTQGMGQFFADLLLPAAAGYASAGPGGEAGTQASDLADTSLLPDEAEPSAAATEPAVPAPGKNRAPTLHTFNEVVLRAEATVAPTAGHLADSAGLPVLPADGADGRQGSAAATSGPDGARPGPWPVAARPGRAASLPAGAVPASAGPQSGRHLPGAGHSRAPSSPGPGLAGQLPAANPKGRAETQAGAAAQTVRPGADARSASPLQVSVQASLVGVDVVVRLGPAGAEDRARLKEEIAALLAAHGLRISSIEIAAPQAVSSQRKDT